MPASSKMDLPLAKAKLNSSGGSSSGVMCLRMGGKKLHLQLEKRGVGICETNSPADTKASEEGEGGGLGTGAQIPLQPVAQTRFSSMDIYTDAISIIPLSSSLSWYELPVDILTLLLPSQSTEDLVIFLFKFPRLKSDGEQK
ncbi:hypothetical protein BTVI_136994 [Pitangus sulphuratus]|nr:hypothetical protein BTVI_136994 [Pitangus sulphuratus]